MTIEYWRCIYDGTFAEGTESRPVRAFRTFHGWDALTESAGRIYVRCGLRPRNADGTFYPLRLLYGPGFGRSFPEDKTPRGVAAKNEWRALLVRLAADE